MWLLLFPFNMDNKNKNCKAQINLSFVFQFKHRKPRGSAAGWSPTYWQEHSTHRELWQPITVHRRNNSCRSVWHTCCWWCRRTLGGGQNNWNTLNATLIPFLRLLNWTELTSCSHTVSQHKFNIILLLDHCSGSYLLSHSFTLSSGNVKSTCCPVGGSGGSDAMWGRGESEQMRLESFAEDGEWFRCPDVGREFVPPQ